MSVFYDSPKGLHIGQCQNAVVTDRATWNDVRPCGAPVIGLGREYPSDRDICGGCQMRTRAFRERLIEKYAAGIVFNPEAGEQWVEETLEGIRDLDVWRFDLASQGVSMEELFEVKADIERREELLEAVLSALPYRGDQ